MVLASRTPVCLTSQHKHLLCLPTTVSPNIKQQSSPALPPPWPIQRINDPPSTSAVPYCPDLLGVGYREALWARMMKYLKGQELGWTYC